MVGGTICDIVKVHPRRWWVNCVEVSSSHRNPQQCGIYLNPGRISYGGGEWAVRAERMAVGDSLWWQGEWAMWTPADRAVVDYKLARIGYSGARRPSLWRRLVDGFNYRFRDRG